MSSYECGVCGWEGRIPWGRECPQCHPKTDQQITFQVLAGRRDEEAIAAAKRYVRGLEAQVQRVRELHYNTATHHPSGCCSECGGTYPCPTVRALDGGAE